MLRPQLALPFPGELIIDNFAGGGGTSTGLEAAFGRPVDIAINHDPEALAMHALNHPYTKHLCESVWDVDPIEVTGNQPVGLVWLSPDCKHFSKAKGGTPVSKQIRGLAWVGMRWIALTKPRVMMLENVEEFQTWGPVIVGPDGNLYPDPKRKGRTFESFVRQLRQHGYQVDWRELRACDNGAPTIRKRLFLVARRDGLPIVWPEATHGEPTSREVLAGMLAPYRTAAECIDFSLPAESIFDRKKALATNTQRRVAKGLWRHVLTSAKPFIVTNTSGHPGAAADQPLPTVTTGNHHMLGQPVMVPLAANSEPWPFEPIFPTPAATTERPHEFHCTTCGNTFPSWRPEDEGIPGACPTCGNEAGISTVSAPFLAGAGGPSYSGKPTAANQPMGTLTTENHRAVVVPTLAPFLTEHANASNQRTMPADAPLRTVCAQVKGGHFSIVAPTLAPLRGTSNGHMGGHSVEQPLSTVAASGTHHAMVGAHLVTIGYGEREGQQARAQDIEAPLGTVVTANKHALVAAHLTHLTHHGDRAGSTPAEPLPTVTASSVPSALASAFFEQANGGFYDGDGRPADAPISTITASGSNQRLVNAYFVSYPLGYGNERAKGDIESGRNGTSICRSGRKNLAQDQAYPIGKRDSNFTDSGRNAAKKRLSRGEDEHQKQAIHGAGTSGCVGSDAWPDSRYDGHQPSGWGQDQQSPVKPGDGHSVGKPSARIPDKASAPGCAPDCSGIGSSREGAAEDRPQLRSYSGTLGRGTDDRLPSGELRSGFLTKYYSEGGQDSGCAEPMHTLPTKARMGLVQSVQVPADALSPEHREKARACAALLHEHMPEHFPDLAELVLMTYGGIWWVLVDITLRMLKARELYRAQSFPDDYIIHEIPDPKLLFKDGVQVPGDPRLIPRIPLSITAQVRMCGNSVSPAQAEALVRANFRHEAAFMEQVA